MDLEFHQLDRRYEDLRLHHPECERRLLASLCEQGQQVPIVVVKTQGSYLVIDGFRRLRCLEHLGVDTVRATLWDLAHADALLLDRSQRSSARPSPIEQGWLLATLWATADHRRRLWLLFGVQDEQEGGRGRSRPAAGGVAAPGRTSSGAILAPRDRC